MLSRPDDRLLCDEDRRILDFEAGWWTRPGPKTADIRRELHMSASAYYRRLQLLADRPEAFTHAPLVVMRLRSRRAQRRRERFEGAALPHQPRR